MSNRVAPCDGIYDRLLVPLEESDPIYGGRTYCGTRGGELEGILK